MGPTGRGTRMWSRRQHGSDDGRWIGLTPLGHGRERLQRSSGSIEKSSTYPSRSSRLGTRYTPRNQRSCLNFDMRFPNPSRKVDVYVCITVCTVLAATACKTKIKNQKLQSIWIYLVHLLWLATVERLACYAMSLDAMCGKSCMLFRDDIRS
jgi:hypothetical protein